MNAIVKVPTKESRRMGDYAKGRLLLKDIAKQLRVHQVTVRQWLSGGTRMPLPRYVAVADILGMPESQRWAKARRVEPEPVVEAAPPSAPEPAPEPAPAPAPEPAPEPAPAPEPEPAVARRRRPPAPPAPPAEQEGDSGTPAE